MIVTRSSDHGFFVLARVDRVAAIVVHVVAIVAIVAWHWIDIAQNALLNTVVLCHRFLRATYRKADATRRSSADRAALVSSSTHARSGRRRRRPDSRGATRP